MINPRQKITINGEGVELLLTPSLYKAALTRGMDLTLHDPDDTAEVWEIYVKHVYLAYRNALDVAAYDGAPSPRRVYNLADFEAWAYTEGKSRFAELMADIVYLRTGKTLGEYVASADDKKKAPPKRISRFWRRGSRSVTG